VDRNRAGIISAVAAYLLWGVLPAYWKLLQSLGSVEILAHRIVWSLVLLAGLLAWRREWTVVVRAFRECGTLVWYAVAAVLLCTNWGFYIWGVNHGQIVEASLGYYINPLVSVLLGVGFLRERLRRLQGWAVGLAAVGVLTLTAGYGRVPWLALVLAVTFGLYGLVKKLSPLGAVPGLALETMVLAPSAVAYLVWLEVKGRGALGHSPWTVTVLLVLAGVVTSMPLLLFARAARVVPLSTMGLLHYLSPTCSLLLGVMIYGEPFPLVRAAGFMIVWGALGLYWLETRWLVRAAPPAPQGGRS
jgi:chloramphenicol-sensitive protein RarD